MNELNNDYDPSSVRCSLESTPFNIFIKKKQKKKKKALSLSIFECKVVSKRIELHYFRCIRGYLYYKIHKGFIFALRLKKKKVSQYNNVPKEIEEKKKLDSLLYPRNHLSIHCTFRERDRKRKRERLYFHI